MEHAAPLLRRNPALPAVVLPDPGRLAGAAADTVRRTQALLLASHQLSTLQAYVGVWRRYTAFCDAEGLRTLADGWAVAAFLAYTRDSSPKGSVRLAHTIANTASALRTVLRLRGTPLSAEDDVVVSRATRAARVLDVRDERSYRLPAGHLIGQSAPVRLSDLAKLAASDTTISSPTDIVCFAAACLAHHSFLRVGEYCDGALVWRDVADDMSQVLIRHGKGAVRGDTVSVPPDAAPGLCPRRWLARLKRAAGPRRTPAHPVFSIGGRPLTAVAMSRWLQGAAAAARIAPGSRVTPHGLRAGGAIDAILSGTHPEVVRVHGRWASAASMAPYMRFATTAVAASMRFASPTSSSSL